MMVWVGKYLRFVSFWRVRFSSVGLAGLLAICLLAGSGCGGIIRGDPDGAPVLVTAEVSRAWVRAHSQKVILIGDGPGAPDGQEVGFGFGRGVWSSSIEVELLAGNRVASDGVVRYPLTWGTNSFQVDLTPDRELYWTVLISGGRSGVIDLGSLVIPAGHEIHIALDAADTEAGSTEGLVISRPVGQPAEEPHSGEDSSESFERTR